MNSETLIRIISILLDIEKTSGIQLVEIPQGYRRYKVTIFTPIADSLDPLKIEKLQINTEEIKIDHFIQVESHKYHYGYSEKTRMIYAWEEGRWTSGMLQGGI